jgi:fermentation-respiration switch protein FrsA (DUF1100 family)
VLLYCHGNSGHVGQRGDRIRTWQEQVGASVLAFDYPGYGRSEGRPDEQGCYAATHAAYEWLRSEQGLSPDRLLLLGKSMGGAMAVELAGRESHHALLLHSAFTSLADVVQHHLRFLPVRWLFRGRFDNRSRMCAYRGPLFVAHGTADRVVPWAHGRELYEACPSSRKAFHALHGSPHAFMDQAYFERLTAFLAGLPTTKDEAPADHQPCVTNSGQQS